MKEEVSFGLSQTQKVLPPKLFYDKKGSHLFNEITKLPEYYLTTAEKQILSRHRQDLALKMGEHCTIIDFGCGNEEKVQLLFGALSNITAYVPVDISTAALEQTLKEMRISFPDLSIKGVRADYGVSMSFLDHFQNAKRVFTFFGSTLGNFSLKEQEDFLQKAASHMREGDGFLLGIDLKKDKQVLEAAYNDSEGITESFNKNVLRRMNKELAMNFDLSKFEHVAFYNEEAGRIEMHLVSNTVQQVSLDNDTFTFRKNETIHTENSYKFSVDQGVNLLKKAGLTTDMICEDENNQFCMLYAVQ
ncbi:L-histidine N(alpha)-methyltransferase [Alkalicoccus saliphilus]|nr:L-histidine N(alpha)-methyltransferase [Alkalicoccus saliphilus]